ncbi:putative PhzF superfamily epimerase YddE/YHI9 [Paenibacillus sp. DS2015]
MGTINYSIVDVFSQGKYTGNQLAVFKNAGSLSDREMQQIAKEIKQAIFFNKCCGCGFGKGP